MNDKISKIELIEFVKQFAKKYGFDASVFANELEDWQSTPKHFIKIKRMGLTVGTIDIKGAEAPNQREATMLVYKTFPEFDDRIDTFEYYTHSQDI